MDMKAIVSMIKEGLRIAFFAGVSALVAWATTKLSSANPTSTFVIAGTIVLKLIDQYVHKSDSIKLNGISPV